MKHAISLPFLFCFLVSLCPLLPAAEVEIYEKTLTLPTYDTGEPSPIPRFYEDRVYQGAQGRIYPYPITDKLTDKKVDKNYQAVYLENEYIKLCVLPEIGGRIFSAVDKTNGYDFFYRQSVIKPALIGMLGAWISGGVEWNIPHHHRANTYMPMTHTIKKNPNGSQTLWLTEIERRHRMKFLLGLTLYPGKSYIEAVIKVFNRTPVVHSFLYFANPSVHVDDSYQVYFPPQTEYVTQHAKREFLEWPIGNSRYGGRDYNNIDISKWKNLTKPVSFFCWEYTEDYFAGYDHNKDAGVAYVGNHHIAPGKKFFTFGSGEQGKMWDKRLTDTDGPYLELMAGAFSDNQPDYSWIQPYETKIVKQYWFPLRGLNGMDYANLNGALNVDFTDKGMVLKLNTTQTYDKAGLWIETQNHTHSQGITISPDRPFETSYSYNDLHISSPKEVQSIRLTPSAEKTYPGKTLMEYTFPKPPGEPMPDPVTPPGDPKNVDTNEELYLTGLRLNQFYNAKIDPIPYYEEALKRDPADARVNTQLGIVYLKQGQFNKAEAHLRRAVQRLTYNYTRPKDCETHYYLGLALRFQNKRDAAYIELYKAIWDQDWKAAGYTQLAELDCLRGDYSKALHHINEALANNTRNTKALNLKSLILARLTPTKSHQANADPISQVDPLDCWQRAEQILLTNPNAFENKLNLTLPQDIEYRLALATDYGNAGFYQRAIDVLSAGEHFESPLIDYYLSYYANKLGLTKKAQQFLKRAKNQPLTLCFPYRLETIDILNYAIKNAPGDPVAPYLLGNLLYDHQPQKAKELWQEAIAKGGDSYLMHRNLGYAITREGKELDQAIAHYEKARKRNPNNARLYYELDKLYETANVDPQKRLALLEKHSDVVKQRDDALSRLVELQILNGDYSDAIDILTHHHFFTWEGGGEIHDKYVAAHILRGRQFLRQNQPRKALIDFRMADAYPDNLEVGRPLHDEKWIRTYYYIAKAFEQLNQKEEATTFYKKAVRMGTANTDQVYYQALAHRALGNETKAEESIQRLNQMGRHLLQSQDEVDFFAKFGARQSHHNRMANGHYHIGLARLASGNPQKAIDEFQKAVKLNVNHVWARAWLNVRHNQTSTQ
ncbi:DUF5107 domain-containing protein [bacterium]|nr:DUF5107 domain-containing protein [bacterium]